MTQKKIQRVERGLYGGNRMSLIIDALKKAQKLRLKEPKGTPVPGYSHPDNKKSLKSLGKRWIAISMGLASLVIFALIFWRLLPLPPTSIPVQTAVRTEKKPLVPIEERKPQEPSKEVLSPPKDVPSPEFIEGSKDVQSLPKDVLSVSKGYPSISPLPLPSKRVVPPIKQMAMEQKAIQPLTATPSPALLKESVPAKSIEVKPEGDKDRAVASETLTHFNLGVQCYNQREFLKAIQSYQKVIELNPTYIEAYNNLGLVYQEIGDLNRAFGAYQKSIEINPQYEKGYNNLGILFYLKGRNEEALESFQKALTINPNNIESHINLGVLYKKQGQMNKAIESYQQALDINPLHRETHYNIALLYEQLENIELAVGHYRQFIKLSSPSHSDLVSKVQRHLDNLMKAPKEKK
jgi:Tfp pilus assembly protein PilF